MNDTIRYLLRSILLPSEGSEALGGVDFASLPTTGAGAALRAFAAVLGGEEAHGTGARAASGATPPGAAFLLDGAHRVVGELDRLYEEDAKFRTAAEGALRHLQSAQPVRWNDGTREALWRVFFPEGAGLFSNRANEIEALRRRRTVTVTKLNQTPLADPAREMLFTSNVLITIPSDDDSVDRLPHAEELKGRIRATMSEVQQYYYDHPIHIGVETEHNEAIYGMRGLDQAIAWEKEAGKVSSEAVASVVLSLSVTHEGLHTVAREYLIEEFRRGGPFENLEIYLFTELECRELVRSVLSTHVEEDAVPRIEEVFGVDGEYGRHYSFLKAIAALWSGLIDPTVRATFKIDLDQVFPQEELARQSGESALAHFTTPLWGAEGLDNEGAKVRLGMIAGALVNEKDIGRGLFTPDVPFPDSIPAGEAAVFYNKVPMALSTEAEMMTRYGDGSVEGTDASSTRSSGPDGRTSCILRYHVTGGTNGILVEDLRRFRPFTPTFVGRAEDQAYLLSVLYEGEPALRYLHKPGLIMRHDKEAFAGEAIEAAKHGRFVGDLVRTLIFSWYTEALPWGLDRTKEQIDPFTGCFVTPRPMSVVFLRLALYCAAIIAADPDAEEETTDIVTLAERKLAPLIADPQAITRDYQRQREAWRLFYDAIDRAAGSPTSATEARRIVNACRIA